MGRTTTSSQSGCLSTLVFLIVAGTLFNLVVEFSDENVVKNKGVNLLLLVLFGFFAFVAKSAILENIKSKARSAEEVLKNDSRAPVLYLRSFGSDTDIHETHNVTESIVGINPYFHLGKAIFNRTTFEQQLAYTLNQVGQFIALSAPGTNEVSLGAAKLAVITDNWQKVVHEYLEKCRLIIIRIGDSEGLLWEIEQIAAKGYLQKLIIYVQFPGPQDQELLEVRFLKFGKMFSRLTDVVLSQNLGKNRYLYFKNGQPELSKSLSHALNEIGIVVEHSDYRGRMKGMWPGADNSFRKPATLFKSISSGMRHFLFFLFSTLVVSVMYSLSAGIVTIWDNCPGTIIMVSIFLTTLFVGVFIGRISVLLNVAGGRIHTLWGLLLIPLSVYVYYSVLWGNWDLFGNLDLLGTAGIDVYLALFSSLLLFIWIPLICHIYSWSKAEQRLSGTIV